MAPRLEPSAHAHTRDEADVPLQRTASGSAEVFVKGVGVHLWQSSGRGDTACNWTHLLRSWAPLNFARFALARLRGGPTVLEVCPNSWDSALAATLAHPARPAEPPRPPAAAASPAAMPRMHTHRFSEDAALAQSLGCNGFRLNLEWSRLEPVRGQLDMAAVARYRAIFDCLRSSGMAPNVTLHHFTAPQWFTDAGGFAVADNIEVFVEFAVKAVRLFGDQVQLWATFNEPVSSAAMGYIFGAYPPGRLLNLRLSGTVLLNMLRAHTAAYHAIKALPGGEQHKVGLTHMLLPFSNWPDLGPFTAHAKALARWMTFCWGWDVVHNYLLTGRFTWYEPSLTGKDGARLVLEARDPKPPLDWFGVNYYSRPVISPLLTPGRKPWQVLTDLGYPIDPAGLRQVLLRCAAYRVPMYVTETGVSIASSAARVYAVDAITKEVLRAMAQGVDVRGVYYWTLIDNFEWNAGYSIRFGLFAWGPWPWSPDRAKRASADTLSSFYRSLPGTLPAAAEAARASDLCYSPFAPLPRWPFSWWAVTLLLLALGLWQAAIAAAAWGWGALLRLLWPAAGAAWARAPRAEPWQLALDGPGPPGTPDGPDAAAGSKEQRRAVGRRGSLATAAAAPAGAAAARADAL